jgi:hypothetical protein
VKRKDIATDLQPWPTRRVFDGENLLSLLVVVPVHVDGDAGILPLEANPRPSAALFVWILGHVFVLLKDRMDAVGGDREAISNTENVSDGLCTTAEALAQFEDALFEIGRILCIGPASRCFQLGNLAVIAVFFGELLDPPPSDLELFSDQGGIHVVINNPLTDTGDIVLVKFHFAWWIVGEIVPTKFLAYITNGLSSDLSQKSG